MQWAIDGAVVSADRDLLTVLGLGFLLLAVIQVAITVLRSWVVLYLGTTLNLQWLANVFSHLLRLPVSFFEKRHLGDVVSRFGAVTTIQRTLTSSFVEALIDGVMAVATLAMMLVYSAALTAVATRRGRPLRRPCAGASTSRCAAPPRSTSSTPPSSRAISSRPCAACSRSSSSAGRRSGARGG